MGANEFMITAKGKDLAATFKEVYDYHRDEYGSDPYSGTIAAKPGVRLLQVEPMTRKQALKKAQQMFDSQDPRCDKWEPAIAIKLKYGEGFLFFGLAPS